jgi:hypothetical protein
MYGTTGSPHTHVLCTRTAHALGIRHDVQAGRYPRGEDGLHRFVTVDERGEESWNHGMSRSPQLVPQVGKGFLGEGAFSSAGCIRLVAVV